MTAGCCGLPAPVVELPAVEIERRDRAQYRTCPAAVWLACIHGPSGTEVFFELMGEMKRTSAPLRAREACSNRKGSEMFVKHTSIGCMPGQYSTLKELGGSLWNM